MTLNKFSSRVELHDKLESEVMNIVRRFTDRKHLPDRRVSFQSTGPCSFDVKNTVFVEDKAHDEYFRLWSEGEPVFIVYKDKNRNCGLFADWIVNLSWSGPHPPSMNSTCGDPFYIISGGKQLEVFLKDNAWLCPTTVP